MKRAADVQVGDVLVFRPDPAALTAAHLPTIYRRVEKIEHVTLRRSAGHLIDFFVIPPRSDGHWRMADPTDEVEVSADVIESCSVLPDGTVIR